MHTQENVQCTGLTESSMCRLAGGVLLCVAAAVGSGSAAAVDDLKDASLRGHLGRIADALGALQQPGDKVSA